MFTLLDESLGFVINKTALILKSELDKNLKHLGITAVQFAVMKRLWEEEGISQKEIADRTFKKTAEITHIIDKLDHKGLLYRQPKKGDRREYQILLTDEGRAMEAEAMKVAFETLQKATQGMKKQEVTTMIRNLEVIYENLT